MLKLRKIQREFDEEPADDLEFDEIPDLDEDLEDVQTAEISNINNEDLPDTINNRKQTTEEET